VPVHAIGTASADWLIDRLAALVWA
jgi:hypothetical protein